MQAELGPPRCQQPCGDGGRSALVLVAPTLVALAKLLGTAGASALRCYWGSRWVPGATVPGDLGFCQGRGRCHLQRPVVEPGIRAGAVAPPAQNSWRCRAPRSLLTAKGWQQQGLWEGMGCSSQPPAPALEVGQASSPVCVSPGSPFPP